MILNQDTPPLTHSLFKISKNGGFYDELPDNMRDTMDVLEPLNIEARYPSQKDKLFAELTVERCKAIFADTEVLYKWVIDKFIKK